MKRVGQFDINVVLLHLCFWGFLLVMEIVGQRVRIILD